MFLQTVLWGNDNITFCKINIKGNDQFWSGSSSYFTMDVVRFEFCFTLSILITFPACQLTSSLPSSLTLCWILLPTNSSGFTKNWGNISDFCGFLTLSNLASLILHISSFFCFSTAGFLTSWGLIIKLWIFWTGFLIAKIICSKLDNNSLQVNSTLLPFSTLVLTNNLLLHLTFITYLWKLICANKTETLLLSSTFCIYSHSMTLVRWLLKSFYLHVSPLRQSSAVAFLVGLIPCPLLISPFVV